MIPKDELTKMKAELGIQDLTELRNKIAEHLRVKAREKKEVEK